MRWLRRFVAKAVSLHSVPIMGLAGGSVNCPFGQVFPIAMLFRRELVSPNPLAVECPKRLRHHAGRLLDQTAAALFFIILGKFQIRTDPLSIAPGGLIMNLTEFIESRREQHLGELYEFLRIPSVSAKSEHKPDIDRASKWVAERLRAAGFKTVEIVLRVFTPSFMPNPSKHPASRRFFSYGHYDVQPAEPLELWTSPAFQPEVRNGNIFGRGTADDKGQVHIHLKALESLHQLHGKFPVNIKVLIEGEEEVGSVSLWDYVQSHKEKLKADALLVSDTSMLGKGVPSITYGLRGLNYYEIELTGPARDLHSGVYGGAVPNPLTVLTELFAELHDKKFPDRHSRFL